jgi:hypothetical protein
VVPIEESSRHLFILDQSFDIATASLLAVFFLPTRFQSNPPEFIDGVHKAFYVLGGMTVLSTIVFCELKREKGTQ